MGPAGLPGDSCAVSLSSKTRCVRRCAPATGCWQCRAGRRGKASCVSSPTRCSRRDTSSNAWVACVNPLLGQHLRPCPTMRERRVRPIHASSDGSPQRGPTASSGRYEARDRSVQNDQGEDAEEHKSDETGAKAGHELTTGVHAGRGLPVRRLKRGSRPHRRLRHQMFLTCTLRYLPKLNGSREPSDINHRMLV